MEFTYLNLGFKEYQRRIYSFNEIPAINDHIHDRLKDPNAILLTTMSKSGTNYTKNIFSNYLNCYYKLDHKEKLNNLHSLFFNSLFSINPNKETPLSFQLYHDHIYRYNYDVIALFSGKRIISYRNPLDYVCSYSNMIIKERKIKRTLNSMLHSSIMDYCQIYINIKKLESKSNTFVTEFEKLYKDPFTTFKLIFTYLNIEINENILRQAIEKSSKKNIKKLENKGEKMVPFHKHSHISNTSITGRWKNELSSKQVSRIEKILNKYEIYLDHFILE